METKGSKKLSQNDKCIRILCVIALLLSLSLSSTKQLSAQAFLTGHVTDEEFAEDLEKAIIQIRKTRAYTVTNITGKFKMRLPATDYQVEAVYPGFYSEYYNISGYDGIHSPMGAVRLTPKYVGRPQQRNIASLVDTKQHPTYSKDYPFTRLMDQSGSTDFNEFFLSEPSAYLLENGGGYGTSELSFRGFSHMQTNVVFNGISLNNPETGSTNSPLYAGMSDWAGQVQLTTGLASGKQSQLGYGGLINILPFMPYDKLGASVSVDAGNYKYLKTTATIHSGISENNFASVLKIDRTAGDGFADQTGFESYGLYLNLYKEFTHMHSLLFTAVMKSWQANQRKQPPSILQTTAKGFDYNNSWGLLDDNPQNLNKSFGINPMAILTHHWHLRVNTRIVSQLFAELNNSAESYASGYINGINQYELPRDNKGLALLDTLSNWNQGQDMPILGSIRTANTEGQYINTELEGYSVLADASKAFRFGIQSQLLHDFNKRTSLQLSIDAEKYQSKHFGTVVDLYNADGYISYADNNNPTGIEVSNLLEPSFLPKINQADRVSSNYMANIFKAGISGKVHTTGDRTYWYIEAASSIRSFNREDYFSYLEGSGLQSSKWVNKIGFRLSSGLTYHLHEHHSLRFNSSVSSSPPPFSQVFPTATNWVNEDATPEELASAELAYVVSGGIVSMSLKGYAMYLQNHSWMQRSSLEDDEQFAIIYDVNQFHYGAEISSQLVYLGRFNLQASASWGNWEYQSDAKAKTYGVDNELLNEQYIPLSGYKISNAPQLSFYVKNEMRLRKGLFINVSYYRAYNRFAPMLIHNFDDTTTLPEQLKLEWYDRTGFGGSYFKETRKGRTIQLSFDIQNVLNSEFINQIFTNYTDTTEFLDNQAFFGNGQTWRIGLTYSY